MGIKFKEVSHSYEGIKKDDFVTAIKDINLNIESENEFVAIVGQTGSGKSTLIQHINGLLIPTSGEVEIFGSTITRKKRKNPKLKPIRKRIGFVFQFPEYQLFEETVLKDIKFAPKIFGYKDEEATKLALDTAKLLGINDHILTKSPFNLSGGQMRKVAIAGILAYNPDVLVLDEPTRGLDPFGAVEIMEIFNNIHTEMNKSMILISHDMDIVYKYATRVIVMKDGMKVFDGKKEDLFKSEYRKYHLEKPQILKTIDYINDKLNYNLNYNIYSEEDLFNSLKAVGNNE